MRQLQRILFLIFVYHVTYSQPLQLGHHYKIKNSSRVGTIYHSNGQSNPNSGTAAPKLVYEPKGFLKRKYLKAGIVQNGSRLTLDIWGITGTDPVAGNSTYINSTDVLGTNDFFYIDLPNRTTLRSAISYVSIPYAAWETGLVTVPFKYYRGNSKKNIPNETVKDFNAGLYFGRRWGRTRFYVDANRKHNSISFIGAVFAGPTIISLAPENTRSQITFKSNELGLSTGFAAMITYRDINVGLLGGSDIPLSSVGRKWNYDSRLWIGFGLGYKLAVLFSK